MIERFAHPHLLWLLLTLPLILAWRWKGPGARRLALTVSDSEAHAAQSGKGWARLRHLPFALRLIGLALLILALARPQFGTHSREITSEGVDIVLAIDISSSMAGEDFSPNNRLQEAKAQAHSFIRKREQDRIGLVVFARQAYTQCPLTLDHEMLGEFLSKVEMGLVEDGTAIGSAIATGANRLRESEAESRVLVLLTDGDNNAGSVDPLSAARAAAAMGVKIYTIGVGKDGQVPYPVDDPLFGRRYRYLNTNLDEATLRQVAEVSQGRYFRAENAEALAAIYAEIDELEKTEISAVERIDYREASSLFLLPGALVLLLELLLSRTILRRQP